jgi:recombination protein RecR
MIIKEFPSKLVDNAVNEFAKLPGIGVKSALRMVLYLLNQEMEESEKLANAIFKLRKEIKNCTICHNISDTDVCNICSNPSRDRTLICVVATIRDVLAIESTQLYKGIYHVLGGIISPMDGLGPGDLKIHSLEEKVSEGKVNELILALSTTMEGDTTNFYLYRKLKNYPVKITTLARGVAIGDELEYTDEITLGRSIVNRTIYEASLSL